MFIVAVAVGVIVLVALIVLIVRSLRQDRDEVVPPTGGGAKHVSRDAGQRATRAARPERAPRPTPTPAPAPVPEVESAAVPQPTVNHQDAPPMARRTPTSQRPTTVEATPAGQPATVATPTVEASPQAPAVSLSDEALPSRRGGAGAAAARRPASAPVAEPLVKPSERRREVPRDPEAVRRSMSGLQSGLARARRDAADSTEPPASR